MHFFVKIHWNLFQILVLISECAEYSLTPHSRSCHHKVSPLLGYRPAAEREFPHTVILPKKNLVFEMHIKRIILFLPQALLGVEKNTSHYRHIEWFCTGVLISHDYVLALAECGFVFPM